MRLLERAGSVLAANSGCTGRATEPTSQADETEFLGWAGTANILSALGATATLSQILRRCCGERGYLFS